MAVVAGGENRFYGLIYAMRAGNKQSTGQLGIPFSKAGQKGEGQGGKKGG